MDHGSGELWIQRANISMSRSGCVLNTEIVFSGPRHSQSQLQAPNRYMYNLLRAAWDVSKIREKQQLRK